MIFANIEYLFLLVLLIPYIIWYVMRRQKTEPTLQVSTTRMYMKVSRSWKIYLLHAPFVLRTVAIVMVILILARPQTTDNWQNTEIEGIDIMLAVDVSTSMLAEDLKPNRLEAAKQVASEFINGRPNDNIGLTIFAGESFTQCPLTVDHGVLLNLFNGIKGDIAQRGLIEDGTAIGMGIANAVTRLKDSKAKSKVIILLTDGSNNRGDISPMTAAEIAKKFGIRVYTIGVGTNGTAPYPVQTYAGTQYINTPVEIDEKTLTEIAGATNGNYFRATSNSKLKEVYQEIDKLEKTKLNVKEFSKREEEYQIFAWIAFFCILLEILLRNSVLKKITLKTRSYVSICRPELFNLLIILPFVVALYLYSNYRRRQNIRKYGDPTLLKHLMPTISKYRPDIKFWLIFAALALVILMLARPQFGSKMETVNAVG